MTHTGTSWFDPSKVDWRRFACDQERVSAGFWPKVRHTLGYVPFLDQALAAYYCSRDPATPLYVKAVIFGALAYFVVPSDLIPDFLVVFGYSDDAAVLATALRTVAPAITDDHRAQARAFLEHPTPSDGRA